MLVCESQNCASRGIDVDNLCSILNLIPLMWRDIVFTMGAGSSIQQRLRSRPGTPSEGQGGTAIPPAGQDLQSGGSGDQTRRQSSSIQTKTVPENSNQTMDPGASQPTTTYQVWNIIMDLAPWVFFLRLKQIVCVCVCVCGEGGSVIFLFKFRDDDLRFPS